MCWTLYDTLLRKEKAFIPELDFVMETDGRLTGQVLFMKSELKTAERPIKVITLGPICILPEYQRKGYGRILLDYSVNTAAVWIRPHTSQCGFLCGPVMHNSALSLADYGKHNQRKSQADDRQVCRQGNKGPADIFRADPSADCRWDAFSWPVVFRKIFQAFYKNVTFGIQAPGHRNVGQTQNNGFRNWLCCHFFINLRAPLWK